MSPEFRAVMRDELRNPDVLLGLAQAALSRAATLGRRSFTEAQLLEHAVKATKAYATGFALQREVIRRVIEEGVDMSRPERMNWHWDFEHAMLVSKYAFLYGTQPRLVTDDRAIRGAAAAAGVSPFVLSVASYQELLNRSSDEFIDILERTRT